MYVVATPELDKLASELYTAGAPVAPLWPQLGPGTKSLWHERAILKLAGHQRWWSVNPDFQADSIPGIWDANMEYLDMTIDSKKVAAQLDIISEATLALASLFRGAGGSGADTDGDESAAKPVRGSKPAAAKPAAAKPAATKGKAKAQPEDDEISIDTVREKLKELVEAKGKEKMVEALESVGAGKLADVDESQYAELIKQAQEFIDEDEAAGPTLDEVNEAAKALINADKPAYLKLSKKLGKPSGMDEDDYAAAIAAYEAAMPEESDDDEDLL